MFAISPWLEMPAGRVDAIYNAISRSALIEPLTLLLFGLLLLVAARRIKRKFPARSDSDLESLKEEAAPTVRR